MFCEDEVDFLLGQEKKQSLSIAQVSDQRAQIRCKKFFSQSKFPAGNAGTDPDAAASTRPTGTGWFIDGNSAPKQSGQPVGVASAQTCMWGSQDWTSGVADQWDQQHREKLQMEPDHVPSGTHT